MMFKPIVYKLNKLKSNHSTIIRQIEIFDENVLNPLVSNYHEGIYGFESVSLNGETEFYTVAPSDYDDVDGIETILDYEMIRNGLDQIHCYSVELRYPSFLPIKVDETPLWEDLFSLKTNMFIQFLIYKGTNNWKECFYDQYEHYLMGNDYPSSNKIGRSFQSKTLTLIDKLSGSENHRKRVPAIEKKLLDDGYKVSFRLMLHDDNVETIENEIQDILSSRDYFNEMVLMKYKNKEVYLNQYTNRVLDVKYAPVLSETELFSLFMEVESPNVHSKPSNQLNNKEIKTFGGEVDINHSVSEILPKNTDKQGVIYLSSILENEQFKKYAKDHPLPVCFGIDEKGELLLGSLVELKHLLIAGSTGSGKSVFLNQLILTLLLNTKPSELVMHLIDPKVVEFVGFEGFPHIPNNIVTDMNEVETLLQSLIDEMEKRYTFLRNKKYKSMVNYNEDNPKNKKPYIVCVIDEFADLIMTNPEIEDYIQRLGQKARAAGIHLICATQRPEAKIISGAIKVNLPSKIAFRCDSSVDYRTIFGKNQPYTLKGKGDGVIRLEGNEEEFVRFQSPVITLDEKEENDTLDQLKKVYTNTYTKTNPSKEPVQEESSKDKLKRIISQTGETRISALQKEMNIRINKVSDLMKELVDDGFLIQDGRSYSIVKKEELSHDERE